MTHTASYFAAGNRDNNPQPLTLTVDGLSKWQPAVVPPNGYDAAGKARKPNTLPLWSPAVYAPGATRSLANVAGACYLAGDIDADVNNRPLTADAFDRVRDTLAASGVNAVVQTTYNHKPDAPRLRVTIPLSRRVSADEYRQLWSVLDSSIQSAVGAKLDPATSDPSRIYYVPAVPTAEALASYRSEVTQGLPVSADTWIAAAGPVRARVSDALTGDDIDEARRERAAKRTFGVVTDAAVQDVSAEAIDYAVRILEPIVVRADRATGAQGTRWQISKCMGGVLSRLGWSAESIRQWGLEFGATYGDGAHSPEFHARNAVGSAKTKSGYYELLGMLPAWKQSQLAGALNAIHNPYGISLKEGREALAASVNLPSQAQTSAPSTAVPDSRIENKLANGIRSTLDDDSDQAPVTRAIGDIDIADGHLTFIAGAPGIGKTPAAMLVALCIANGISLGDRVVDGKRPVTYANFEKPVYARSIRRRIAQGLGVDPKSVQLFHLSKNGYMLNAKGAMNPLGELTDVLKEQRAAHGVDPVLIVDTYNNAVGGMDAKDNMFAEPLRDLRNGIHAELQCPIVVAIHAKKSASEKQHAEEPITMNDIAGTGQLVGLCDAIIGLHRPDPKNKNRVRLTSVRSIANDMADLTLEWCGENNAPLTAKVIEDNTRKTSKPPKESGPELQESAADKLVAYLRTPINGREREELTRDKIANTLGDGYRGHKPAQRKAVKYAIDVAVERGLLTVIATGNKRAAATYRRIPPPEAPYQNVTPGAPAFDPSLFMSLSGGAADKPR